MYRDRQRFISKALLFSTSQSDGSLKHTLQTAFTRQARVHIQEHKVLIQHLSYKSYLLSGKDREK